MFHPVILAGGGGTRLWPASRRHRPKQFLPIGKRPGESLIGATHRRLGELAGQAHTWVVTAAEQVPAVEEALPFLGRGNILAEPIARNTSAAIGLAAVHIAARDPEAILGVLPADHHIDDEDAFREIVGRAFALAARVEAIVTVGVVPTKPETGFGYLELGAGAELGARSVVRFVEKPDHATAIAYVSAGYLWNAGMFFVSARHVLAEIRAHLPALADGLDEIAAAIPHDDVTAVTERVYPRLPAISFDYGIMEKTRGTLALAGDFGWNDVGSWTALAEYRAADAAGNVVAGDGVIAVTSDAHHNIIVGDPDRLLALVGVNDLCVVQAGEAVLVMPRDRAQDVREIVRLLKERKLDKYL